MLQAPAADLTEALSSSVDSIVAVACVDGVDAVSTILDIDVLDAVQDVDAIKEKRVIIKCLGCKLKHMKNLKERNFASTASEFPTRALQRLHHKLKRMRRRALQQSLSR